jgi:hypothetical protein
MCSAALLAMIAWVAVHIYLIGPNDYDDDSE